MANIPKLAKQFPSLGITVEVGALLAMATTIFYTLKIDYRNKNTFSKQIIEIMNLLEISKQYPDLNLTVRAGELFEMVNLCIQNTCKELTQLVTDANTETYPSSDKVAEILDVSKPTLWRWRKQNYLVPISVGGKIRYRMSDVKRLLGEK